VSSAARPDIEDGARLLVISDANNTRRDPLGEKFVGYTMRLKRIMISIIHRIADACSKDERRASKRDPQKNGRRSRRPLRSSPIPAVQPSPRFPRTISLRSRLSS